MSGFQTENPYHALWTGALFVGRPPKSALPRPDHREHQEVWGASGRCCKFEPGRSMARFGLFSNADIRISLNNNVSAAAHAAAA